MRIEANESVPTEIEWRYKYYPIIWYNNIDKKWKIEHQHKDDINELLFRIEAESLEELIWKVWEYIEKHEYSEIYDLTYNFKKYELK